MREKEIEKVEDPMILYGWIIYPFHLHFLFPHQIRDPKTTLMHQNNIVIFHLSMMDMNETAQR